MESKTKYSFCSNPSCTYYEEYEDEMPKCGTCSVCQSPMIYKCSECHEPYHTHKKELHSCSSCG